VRAATEQILNRLQLFVACFVFTRTQKQVLL